MNAVNRDLIEKLRRGDLEAFDQIYEDFAGKIHAFALKYLRSEAEAEELVQSVFLRLWENRGRIDKELSFSAYLFTIAYNDICKLFRRKSYLKKYIEETVYRNRESSSSAEEGTEYRSVLGEVEKVLAGLPLKQKRAFELNRIDGKPSGEVAAELGLSVGTVDNYVSATLKVLRSKLGSESLAVLLFISLFVF
ncbi:MAG: RNA polymerase sigma-70 factor [Bacteroidales bacterium]|nr:RNA polymerase sigma-70 factor [Bacteroidales bacterium]